ncbi:PTS sugar transporter subunit IIA [Variovorax sp. PvP013]|jgi:PTS system mannose-specific IIA component|uniref:PTS sugar transporter subunit IIA n=1 Tax=Variovorax sp. PvP013 TaxID=3156435 RepID=UPI002C647DA1|nr:PTS fructose transporter subunit IIA [Variovorax sp.]
MNSILIIAHAPLANALRQCALHVFPESESTVFALDVLPNVSAEETLAVARITLEQMQRTPDDKVLVLGDMFGATPCNVAHKLVDGVNSRLVAGVNLPMLIRVLSYRREPLHTLAERAVVGGGAGVMQVAVAAPQNQSKRKPSDKDHSDDQQ